MTIAELADALDMKPRHIRGALRGNGDYRDRHSLERLGLVVAVAEDAAHGPRWHLTAAGERVADRLAESAARSA